MPVEIKELQIKVTVNQPNAPTARPSPEAAPGGEKDDKKAIVSQCIEQVMEILENKKER
jgi:hypothetical protein